MTISGTGRAAGAGHERRHQARPVHVAARDLRQPGLLPRAGVPPDVTVYPLRLQFTLWGDSGVTVVPLR